MFGLATPRLHLRQLRPDDFDALFAILSDPETMTFYPRPYSTEMVQEWLDRNLRRYTEWGHALWAVELLTTGEVIAQCGITYQDIDGESLPEIGYQFNRHHWGRGYATEAARACLDYSFQELNFDEIFIHTYEKNRPSQKVAERLGMQQIKTYDKHLKGFGLTWPHVVYSMTRDQYPGPAEGRK